jgi:glycosyltransferase involved in cell wall biosynthesis
MPVTETKNKPDLSSRTIVYALGIYINPGMRRLLLEYLKRAAPNYKAIYVVFCYWWPGIDREPFVDMVNSLGIPNLKAREFAIMASPAFGRKLGWPGANWFNATITTFREINRMAGFFREIGADLIHIILTEYQASYAFARAARRAGVKSKLLSFTGVAPTPAKFRIMVNRLTDRMLTGVLLATNADIEGARKYFPHAPLSVVHGWGLAPNLFGLDKVNPQRIRDELSLKPSDLLIGTTTRIAPNKGQDTLLKALPDVITKFPNLTCAILGGRYDSDQIYRSDFEKLANDLGISDNVRFLGERNDSADIFAACDVAVHLPDHDYLPFGVLECMALGKPCLCTRVGGIPDVITDNETGFMIDAGDVKNASEKLIQLLSDPTLRSRLGAAAHKFVIDRYDLNNLVVRVKQVYSDSLK